MCERWPSTVRTLAKSESGSGKPRNTKLRVGKRASGRTTPPDPVRLRRRPCNPAHGSELAEQRMRPIEGRSRVALPACPSVDRAVREMGSSEIIGRRTIQVMSNSRGDRELRSVVRALGAQQESPAS
jgi:hypothetical protein